jgi:hypothetical protein
MREYMASEKTFISYSWTTPEHESWVLNFAEELVSSGVDVILDKWELKEGHDLIGFMERMVTDESVKKVIMICDKSYSERADGRSGGVGTETQIISQKVYENQNQEKFVAVIVEKDESGKAYVPTYYTSRKYIDLSPESDYSKNYEILLRWLFNRPLHVKPPLGKPPAFLSEENASKIITGVTYRRAVQSIKESKPNSHIEIDSYYKKVLEELEKFRMSTGKSDEEILNNLESLIPLRNELSQTFELISLYNPSKELITITMSFFEQLCDFFYPKEQQKAYSTSDFDNYKFIAHEAYLLLISAFLRNNRFEECKVILQKKFYINNSSEPESGLHSFGIFYNHLYSLERINQSSETRWISYHANLLKERCESENGKFNQIIQADLICYLYYAFLSQDKYDSKDYWYPFTLIYSRGFRPLEVFDRAADKAYFKDLCKLFPIENMNFFNIIAKKIEEGEIKEPSFDHERVSILRLINYDNLNSI